MLLLDQPHHDGSELYVSDSSPVIGQRVTVRLRVPAVLRTPITGVRLRTMNDGEPLFIDATPAPGGAGRDQWWDAELSMRAHEMHYRWALSGDDYYAWLNGTGIHYRDVPDVADFQLTTHGPGPSWARDAVVYQIFPDRFARSASADERRTPEWAVPTPWDAPLQDGAAIPVQFYGGDLDGIIDHLDHIQSVGADVIYLTPVFPGRSNHRYDASTFDHVDPLLGGDDALARLTAACHERGLRVLGDITSNHTGSGHEWFQRARADEGSPERDFYFWDDSPLGYACWLGWASLPKLNYGSRELRRRFYEASDSVVQRWLRPPFGLDGWRVDVANMTGRYQDRDDYLDVARGMRRAVESARPDGLVVAEHCHDLRGEVSGDSWHGAMNYAAFTRPMWTWLRDPRKAPQFLGSPLHVPRLGGVEVMETIRDFSAQLPWVVLVNCFNLLGSHDTTRIATLTGDDPGVIAAGVTALVGMPGVPLVTYGDEIGMPGTFGEDGRRPMPWLDARRHDSATAWDDERLTLYRSALHARRSSRALTHGGLRWVFAGPDLLVWLRETKSECVLVAASRSAHEPVELPVNAFPGIATGRPIFGAGIELADDHVRIPGQRAGGCIWRWAQV